MRLPEPFFPRGEHLAIELPGAQAAFTTRLGGVSGGPYATLNLGKLTGDEPAAVERNRGLVEQQFEVVLHFGRQVHGPRVMRVTSLPLPSRADPAESDGQATTLERVGVMVFTADCLPIAIAGEGAVAMIHAGWRGLASGVLGEGVRAVRELGARGPLAAAIGPGAGRCCYEVGDEVHAAFADRTPSARNGRNLDLKAIASAQLDEAGVGTIHDCELCTICSEQFFSHRRDHGVTGRQAGLAWLN